MGFLGAGLGLRAIGFFMNPQVWLVIGLLSLAVYARSNLISEGEQRADGRWAKRVEQARVDAHAQGAETSRVLEQDLDKAKTALEQLRGENAKLRDTVNAENPKANNRVVFPHNDRWLRNKRRSSRTTK